MSDAAAPPKNEYGVTPTDVMASMAGIDFVRAIFSVNSAQAVGRAIASSPACTPDGMMRSCS